MDVHSFWNVLAARQHPRYTVEDETKRIYALKVRYYAHYKRILNVTNALQIVETEYSALKRREKQLLAMEAIMRVLKPFVTCLKALV